MRYEAQRTPPSHNQDPQELFSFDKLITPQYVQVLFWIGVVASVIGGLVRIATGIATDYGGSVLIVWGLTILVLGPILTRVGCELLVLSFKVVDWIAEIKVTLAKQQQQRAEQRETRPQDGSPASPEQAASKQGTSPPRR